MLLHHIFIELTHILIPGPRQATATRVVGDAYDDVASYDIDDVDIG